MNPELLPDENEPETARQRLEMAFVDYVTTVSTPQMAASKQTVGYLDYLCRKFRPRRVCDFGSGFSSYVLARYAAEHDAEVVSVDDSVEWLDKTAEFLERYGLPTEQLCLIDDFAEGEFDLIFYDYAGGDIRNELYESVTGMVAPGGVIIYDDAHHGPHAEAMQAAADKHDLELVGLQSVTKDEMGRYSTLGLAAGAGCFTTMSLIASQYAEACKTPSDISQQLPIMVDRALELGARTIVELGTRGGVSTVGWLHVAEQTDGHVWSVDIDPAPENLTHVRWTFIHGDDMQPETLRKLPRAADVVFIDTSHHYTHTLGELNVYARRVRPGGVLMLHDSELERPEGWTRAQPLYPVKAAITEFCQSESLTPEWFETWPGLAIIPIPE